MSFISKIVLTSLVVLFSLNTDAKAASIPDEVEGYLNQIGLYNGLINNQVDFSTLTAKCLIKKNETGEIYIDSPAAFKLSSNFKNARYATHSETETVSIYESLVAGENNQSIESYCGNKESSSYKQLVVVTPYSISIQENIECKNSKRVTLSQSCLITN